MISRGKPIAVGVEYRDIRCLSTDTKPTKNVPNGSRLVEIDTGKVYLFDYQSGEWNLQPANGGGSGTSLSPISVQQVHTITGV